MDAPPPHEPPAPALRGAASTTALLAALGAIGIVIWQVGALRRERARALEEHASRGAVLVEAIVGVASRELRGLRYDPVALEESLEDALTRLGLRSITVTTDDGEPLVAVGVRPTTPDPLHHFGRTFEPLRPRQQGLRRRWAERNDLTTLDAQSLRLELVTDPGPLALQLREAASHFAVASCSLLASLALLTWLAWTRLRAAGLRFALESQRREVEHLERLRRVGTGLVHETKNPLAVVRGLAERIVHRRLEAEELERTARAIVDETDRTLHRLDEFLLYSRPARLRRTRVELCPLFEELAVLIEPELESRNARLEIECAGGAVEADRDQLRRLLLNILLNAAQSLDPGGTLRLVSTQGPHGTRIVVEDDGPGVPEEIEDALFEPYVSGRANGSGLGLSIARRIAEDHGFELRHERRAPRGARFVLDGRCEP